jgi:hypothetical protein
VSMSVLRRLHLEISLGLRLVEKLLVRGPVEGQGIRRPGTLSFSPGRQLARQRIKDHS